MLDVRDPPSEIVETPLGGTVVMARGKSDDQIIVGKDGQNIASLSELELVKYRAMYQQEPDTDPETRVYFALLQHLICDGLQPFQQRGIYTIFRTKSSKRERNKTLREMLRRSARVTGLPDGGTFTVATDYRGLTFSFQDGDFSIEDRVAWGELSMRIDAMIRENRYPVPPNWVEPEDPGAFAQEYAQIGLMDWAANEAEPSPAPSAAKPEAPKETPATESQDIGYSVGDRVNLEDGREFQITKIGIDLGFGDVDVHLRDLTTGYPIGRVIGRTEFEGLLRRYPQETQKPAPKPEKPQEIEPIPGMRSIVIDFTVPSNAPEAVVDKWGQSEEKETSKPAPKQAAVPDSQEIADATPQDLEAVVRGQLRDQQQAKQADSMPGKAPAQPLSPAQNIRLPDNHQPPSAPKKKYAANVAAIRLLKELEAAGRPPTPEDQEILARFSGWGGIPKAFDAREADWAAEAKELKELLTPEEYRAARASTLNAHYTSMPVIDAMYRALERFGFDGGNINEPALGAGHFFGRILQSFHSITQQVDTHYIVSNLAKNVVLYGDSSQPTIILDYTYWNLYKQFLAASQEATPKYRLRVVFLQYLQMRFASYSRLIQSLDEYDKNHTTAEPVPYHADIILFRLTQLMALHHEIAHIVFQVDKEQYNYCLTQIRRVLYNFLQHSDENIYGIELNVFRRYVEANEGIIEELAADYFAIKELIHTIHDIPNNFSMLMDAIFYVSVFNQALSDLELHWQAYLPMIMNKHIKAPGRLQDDSLGKSYIKNRIGFLVSSFLTVEHFQNTFSSGRDWYQSIINEYVHRFQLCHDVVFELTHPSTINAIIRRAHLLQ